MSMVFCFWRVRWRAMPIEMVRPFNRRAKRGLKYGKVAVPVLFVALKAYFWMR